MKAKIVILIIGSVLLSGCVAPQTATVLDQRVSRLEQRLEAIDRSGSEQAGETQMARDQSAELRVLIEDLRKEIQLLSGRVDEIDHLSKRKFKSTEEKSNLLEQDILITKGQVIRLEQYLNLESTGPRAPARSGDAEEKPDPSTETNTLSEDGMYQTAKQAFDEGDFEAARKGFSEIIKQFPESEQVDNAQFWIGETYYREKWYEKAILEYQKVIENYPKGNKVPASLLKQGFAFFNIGDKANSRLILQELVEKHPSSHEAKIASEKLQTF